MNIKLFKQNTSQRRDLILHGSIAKTIIRLSLPTLLMGTVQCAIPLIDGLFINNIAGNIAAGAVTYCTPIIGMVVGLAAGLGSAGMALIGQTNGKGQLSEGRRIATQLIMFAAMLGTVLAPVLFALAYPVSAQVDAQIAPGVFTYLALSAISIPFSFLESIYNAIKNASGNPEATFVRMVILLIVKVIFNALFIAVLRWGVAGAAMAS
jgi:Na+-driven multidrug efflux pump